MPGLTPCQLTARHSGCRGCAAIPNSVIQIESNAFPRKNIPLIPGLTRDAICRYEEGAVVTGVSIAARYWKGCSPSNTVRHGNDVVVTRFNNMDGVNAVAEETRAMDRRSMMLRMNGRDLSSVKEQK